MKVPRSDKPRRASRGFPRTDRTTRIRTQIAQKSCANEPRTDEGRFVVEHEAPDEIKLWEDAPAGKESKEVQRTLIAVDERLVAATGKVREDKHLTIDPCTQVPPPVSGGAPWWGLVCK